jgi:hypothetical protein
MLSSCFKADCRAPFRYLRQGKLFAFQIRPVSRDGFLVRSAPPEFFWLCDNCASQFTLILEQGTRVRCVQVQRPPAQACALAVCAAVASEGGA